MRFSLVLGVIASAGAFVACGDGTTTPGPLDRSGAPANGLPPTNGAPATNGQPANGGLPPAAGVVNPVGVTPTDSTPSNEGVVPPVGGVNPGTPTSPPPSAGGEEGNPDVTGEVDEGDVDEGEGDTAEDAPVISGGPGTPEPTNCNIPAPATTPIGYGAATTGGGNRAPVIVNSFAQAEAALAAYRAAFKDGTETALVLRYTGTFDYGTITDVCAQHTQAEQLLELKEMSNVTFEGAPGSSANFGIHVNRAKNVIIRNMTMGLLPGGGNSDAITIEGNGTNGDVENVWVDHNELFSSTKDDCDGAGDTEFDGLIDIKKGARRITISYNYLHDHQKTGLIGFSDDDDTERYVTFHHNRYENVVSRTPLHRFGFVHLFNNYYGKILDSGINVRMGGVALVESNFFEDAANPVTSRFSDVVGFWDLRNNHVGPGITWTLGDDVLANADDWQSTTTFPANELNYTYTPDEAGCVKQIVLAQAGAKL